MRPLSPHSLVADGGSGPDVGLPEVSQIAFVVDDLESAMDRFGRLLGLGPWFLYRYEPPRLTGTTYRGEPADYAMRIALTDVGGPIDLSTRFVSGGTLRRVVDVLTSLRDRLGIRPSADGRAGPFSSLPTPGMPGVMVELIEPLEGPSTYTDEFADGDGIHHVGCYAFDDPRAVVEASESAGIEVVQRGRFEGVEFWYLDMSDHIDGLLLEVAADVWAIPPPDGMYPG
jgi:hypothetical protein